VPLFLFSYVFGQFAIYRARRYRLTRTVWRGVRFWMDGSGWAYAWRALLWGMLTFATLGLALPWREAALERYKMRHCHYGDLAGRFEGRGWEFFVRGWWLWLIALLPVITGIAAPVIKGIFEQSDFVVGLLLLVWVFSIPFIYGRLKAIEWRWWISGIHFGEVCFKSDLSPDALQGLYWKVIGWSLLLLAVLLTVCMTVCLWIGASTDSFVAAMAYLQNSPGMKLAVVVSYLVFIVALNVVLRIYLLRDVWARVAASTRALYLEAVANVAAKGELAGALGEGLTGDLDIVGF
jgi:uncharacterized membrane protein YjgN (DUF898 family)